MSRTKSTDYSRDAWKIADDHRRANSKSFELRKDLKIHASGVDRCVWIGHTQHNVKTVREYIEQLQDACDFVEKCNPGWASHPKDITIDMSALGLPSIEG